MKFDVVILAGGLGTRLSSVVSAVPKPMAPVANRPFLDHILDALPHQHIGNIILATGHLSEVIEDYYQSEYNGINIVYSREEQPLGTGGAISKALKESVEENVMVINGDTFFDLNYEEFWQVHSQKKNPLTIALKQMQNPDRYGTVLLESHSIVRFQEKKAGLTSGLINGGVYFIHKSLKENLPVQEKYSFESEVLEKMVHSKLIGGYLSGGLFIDIGIPSDYERAQKIFA